MDSDASRVTSRQGGVMRASKTFTVLLEVVEVSWSRSYQRIAHGATFHAVLLLSWDHDF